MAGYYGKRLTNKDNYVRNNEQVISYQYDKALDMYERIKVHATDKFPERLFREKAPNETQQEFEYRKKTYRSNTRKDWTKALNVVNRIWNEQNYSLSFKDTAVIYGDNTMDRYILEDYPIGGSLLSYFKNIVTKSKSNDPNGVLVVKPDLQFQYDESGEVLTNDGEYVIDDRNLIEPVVHLYHTGSVIDYVESQHCLILTDKHVKLDEGKGGLVFEFYDKEAIYEVRQYGKKSDWTFEVFVYYRHNLGWMPCWKLKGIPLDVGEKELYKSPFYDAVDLLDSALYDYSTLQASKVSHAYLEKWEFADECSTCSGTGKVFTDEHDGTCNTCHGYGYQPKASVLGVYQIRTKGIMQNPDDAITPPPAGYIDKNPTILEFLKRDIADTKREAFSAINLEVTDRATGTETATARFLDREEMFSFLIQEANQNFELLNYCLYAIGYMRYGDNYNGHSLTVPQQFGIYSPSDLTVEISEARKSNLPGIAIAGLTNQYIKTRFSGTDGHAQRLFAVINYCDGIAYLSENEINNGLTRGVIAKWQAILHINIQSYIAQKENENPEFLMQELPTIKEELEAMAKAQEQLIAPNRTAESILETL